VIEVINFTLLTFLVVVALAIVRIRNLFAVTLLTGLYGLVTASLFVLLDAVDVALTEAAVGAGIMIILLLGTLVLTSSREKVRRTRHNLMALAVCTVTGACLI
jgi:multicomponent Na+:H+ antiporter subunit B